MKKFLVTAATLLVSLAATVTAVGPAQALPAGKKYVAFGDSYASGPNLGSPRDAIAWGLSGCKRGDRNYPSRIAWRKYYTYNTDWIDYSCAGALAGTGGGQGGLATQIQWAVDQQALGNSTERVTVTITGNDVWASGKVTPYQAIEYCVKNTDDCSTNTQRPLVTDLTKTKYLNLVKTQIERIRANAPNATIQILGYPAIVSNQTVSCQYANLTATERSYLDQLIRQLSLVIYQGADEMNRTGSTIGKVQWVDTHQSSVANSICPAGGLTQAWVNGNSAPADSEGITGQTYHPRGLGTNKMGDLAISKFAGSGATRP